MHDTKERLSLLWIFALLNYLYADVVALFAIAGSRNSFEPLSPWALMGSAVLMEIPIAMILALLSGCFQLAVAFRVDLLLTPRQHVLRREVAGGTVQADVVVMLHVALDQTPCIFQRQRRSRAGGPPSPASFYFLNYRRVPHPFVTKAGFPSEQKGGR